MTPFKTEKRVKSESEHSYRDDIGQVQLQERLLFIYEMLEIAIENFQNTCQLREGGLGTVY